MCCVRVPFGQDINSQCLCPVKSAQMFLMVKIICKVRNRIFVVLLAACVAVIYPVVESAALYCFRERFLCWEMIVFNSTTYSRIGNKKWRRLTVGSMSFCYCAKHASMCMLCTVGQLVFFILDFFFNLKVAFLGGLGKYYSLFVYTSGSYFTGITFSLWSFLGWFQFPKTLNFNCLKIRIPPLPLKKQPFPFPVNTVILTIEYVERHFNCLHVRSVKSFWKSRCEERPSASSFTSTVGNQRLLVWTRQTSGGNRLSYPLAPF